MIHRILLLCMLLLVTGCDDKSSAEARVKCSKSLNIETSSDSDFEDALPYCKKAAEAGSAQAQLNLGYMYLYGKAVEQNKSAAIEWLNKAADNDSLEAKAVLIPIPRENVNSIYACEVGEERLFSQYAVNGSCSQKRALDDDWRNVFFSKENVVNYNLSSVVGSGDQKKVWWEIYTSKIPGLDTIKSGYTKYLTIYNCETGKQQPVQIKDYRDGELAASFEKISLKEETDPDSFSGMIFKEVCKKQPAR